jgi:hypothetical protein
MRFIKLTDLYSESPVYINLDHISGISKGDDRTFVYIVGDAESYFSVKETPEEIFEIIFELLKEGL